MQHMMFSKQTMEDTDNVSRTLRSIAQNILIVVLGLLPILFIPLLAAPFAYSKTLLVLVAVSAALIFFALSVLRSGTFSVRMPLGLGALWGVAGISVLAALFSGDVTDAFIGERFSVHTAAFALLLALVASSVTILRDSKSSIIRLYTLITVSTLVLGVFHLLRLFFGADMLSFGIFTNQVSSLIGAWNDLALFFGLAILLALVAVEQLPLTKWGRIVLGAVTVFALILLTVVNFFSVWLVLGIVSLVMLMFSLTKNRFAGATLGVEKQKDSSASIVLSAIVFIFSLLFIIGGGAIGGAISNVTNISYVEVRPSFTATLDVAGAVFEENAFLGVGPNKFADAWRLHKDPSINQTIFWNTDFEAGNGYITTALVQTGVFGVLAWLAFLGVLVWQGVVMLFRTTHSDRFWYFIATSSTVAALYLWGMSLIYVPTVSILLLAAACTGVMMTAYNVLVPGKVLTLSMMQSRHAGFALVTAVMIVIVGSVSVMYFTGRHYAALYAFNDARLSITDGVSLDSIEQKVAGAFTLSANDRFAREIAEYQLARLTNLLNTTDPTEVQQQQFQDALQNGVNAAQLAIDSDPQEARNWQTLGQIYAILIAAGVEGAYERSIEAYNQAAELDPLNPVLPLLRAQAESRVGNLAAARAEAEASVALKRDFTEGLVFLTQLDIAEGKVEEATARTEALVALEPRNPGRLYQLGILYSTSGTVERAVAAFQEAVRLDPDYANARYLLALGLLEQGDNEGAIEQLERVFELNPDNQQIGELITALRNGEVPTPTATQISEPATVSESGDSVTTTEDPDTPLVSPVNTVPDNSTADSESEAVTEDEVEASATTTDAG